MVLEKLGASLKGALQKVTKALFVDDRVIDELCKEVERSLLAADVNVKLGVELAEKIRQRIKKEEPPKGLSKKEQLVNLVYEELAALLGREPAKLEIKKRPTNVLLLGLFGNGKTTTAGKLALWYQRRGLKVALVCLDVWRPAAAAQLAQLAQKLELPFFGDPNAKDSIKLYRSIAAQLKRFDLVLFDTAGRDALSPELIKELKALNKTINPEEKLLVLAADIGQAAERQAREFHAAVGLTGVILTKLDGTAKGGGALAACALSEAKVKFIGTGEHLDDFEPFEPAAFVGRILGIGDIKALLAKAEAAMKVDEAALMAQRIAAGQFNLLDLYAEMEAMAKMGPLGKLLELVPGLGQLGLPKELISAQESKLAKWRAIINSCTKAELENPKLIEGRRIERIAKGSSQPATEVRELLKQWRMARKMFGMLKGKGAEQLFKRLAAGFKV